MTITTGDRVPDATLISMGDDGPEQVDLAARLKGRKVVVFAVPGAFTPTCSSAHVPSFIRTAGALRAKGVDEIICVSVNDAHVMRVWGETTGATAAGIAMLADGDSSFTDAMGMEFSAPPVGMMRRSKRYAMLVDDGTVKLMHVEVARGVCEISGGEAMLAAI